MAFYNLRKSADLREPFFILPLIKDDKCRIQLAVYN